VDSPEAAEYWRRGKRPAAFVVCRPASRRDWRRSVSFMIDCVARIPAFGPKFRDHSDTGPGSKVIAGLSRRPDAKPGSEEDPLRTPKVGENPFWNGGIRTRGWSEPPARPEIEVDRAGRRVILKSRPRPRAGGLLTPDVLIGNISSLIPFPGCPAERRGVLGRAGP
jgi:hypothetical protein